MIEGRVSADGDAIVTVTVRGFMEQEVTIEGVVDTGFGGALSLHPDHVPLLGLVPSGSADVVLADGSQYLTPIYDAIVEWDGVQQIVQVIAGDDSLLLGMDLLRGFNLSVDVEEDGMVLITRLARS